MEGKILFSEKQRFNQWWLWAILIGINFLFLYVAIFQPNIFFTFSFVFTLILTVLFLSFRLDTQITAENIYVRFYPLQLKYREYMWSEISKCTIRQYSPIGEYGGWGLRGFGKDKAINISGNYGLQLEFKNNHKLLIGTNKIKELTDAVGKIGKLNV